MIIAETPHQAMDAAEIMEIDYEELPWVTDTAAAAEAGSPTIWEQSPTNTPVDTLFGDPVATEAAFARAAHVVKMNFHIGRVTGVPLEPRSALAIPDPKTGRITLYAGSGGAVRPAEATHVPRPDDRDGDGGA